MPPAYKMKDNAVRALLFLPYPCHQAHLFFFFFLFLILTENSFFPISYCARHLVHGTGANSPNLNRSRACEQNTYQAINLDHSRRHHNLFGRSRLRKRPHRSCDSQFHDKTLTSGKIKIKIIEKQIRAGGKSPYQLFTTEQNQNP